MHAHQVKQAGQSAACGRVARCRRTKKRQFGRGRIAAKGLHHVQARNLKSAQAVAQRGFDRVFPTGLHLDAAPQALQMLQPVLLQPGLQFAVGLEALLQGFERLQTRGHVGLARSLVVDLLLLRAAGLVQLRHQGLQFLQAGVGQLGGLLRALKLFLQLGQAAVVGGGQAVAVGGQALAPGAELAVLLGHAALLSRQHAQGLLDLGHAVALGLGLRLGAFQRFFQVGQLLGLVFNLGFQQFGLLVAHQRQLGQALYLLQRLVAALGPLGALLGQGDQALLHALAAFDHKADFRLQAPHLCTGLVKQPLHLVDLVARSVVGLADRFQIGLNVAQIGHA